MHFSIQGEFITEMARQKLYGDCDLESAIRILRGALHTNEITPDEQLVLCLQVLNGDAWIKGESGTEEYGLEMRDDIEEVPTQLDKLCGFIKQLNEKLEEIVEENGTLMRKMNFITETLPDYKLRSLNDEYYSLYEESLFKDVTVDPEQDSPLSGMLASFMEQRKREDAQEEPVCDYGWLDPSGTFYPVEWGRAPDLGG